MLFMDSSEKYENNVWQRFTDELTKTLSVHNTRTVDFKSERGE